jgi:hypothetical protein
MCMEGNALRVYCRKGNCWDNSPTERFFRSLKSEQLNYEKFRTRTHSTIFKYYTEMREDVNTKSKPLNTNISPSVTCYRHDMAEKLLIWR